MTGERPRVVFDCNIFLQAILGSGGPAAACMDLIDEGEITLVVSPDVLAEVRDVLTRPKLVRKFPSLSPERVERFLTLVEDRVEVVKNVPRVVELARDPKDEPYINLAIAAEVRFLVTRDNDLLDLMTDESLQRLAPSLIILDPVAFLRKMAAWYAEQAPERERGRDVDA